MIRSRLGVYIHTGSLAEYNQEGLEHFRRQDQEKKACWKVDVTSSETE